MIELVAMQMVSKEIHRQQEKWGIQNHDPMTWLAILTEEVGEVAKAVLEGNSDEYRKELIQVAAVCISALMAEGEGQ
jgi:NTP pyrophosphatase (non-canonical NTP hydrolase)